jgi:hypothetical protein
MGSSILALCVNVLISQAGPAVECKVLEDSREIWQVECNGEVLKLPDYACIYADGSDKLVVVED